MSVFSFIGIIATIFGISFALATGICGIMSVYCFMDDTDLRLSRLENKLENKKRTRL